MLKIINDLKPFFEDNYRRINIREYARIRKIAPPTASKLLGNFYNKSLLKKEADRIYIYYYANKENNLFIDLSRIYWKIILKNSGIIDFFEKEFLNPLIILFGSLAKAEAKKDSDVDLAVFAESKKKPDLKDFEKKLKREIQLFVFKNMASVKNKELLKNIFNGYKIRGSW